MQTRLYVANLDYNTTDADLRTAFSNHGTVKEAKVIKDKANGKSKGFGFVEMATEREANLALGMDGEYLQGRKLKVSPALPKKKA